MDKSRRRTDASVKTVGGSILRNRSRFLTIVSEIVTVRGHSRVDETL